MDNSTDSDVPGPLRTVGTTGSLRPHRLFHGYTGLHMGAHETDVRLTYT